MAQLVKHLTLDFGSGHNLRVLESKPHIRLCADSTDSAWDSLSAPPQLMHVLFLSVKISIYFLI